MPHDTSIRPIPPVPEPTFEQVAAAVAWGKAHGYDCNPTHGDIYNARGRRIAQSWTGFAKYLIAMGVRL